MNNDFVWTWQPCEKTPALLKQYTQWAHLWRRVLKWVMPASSALLITAELGRIVAVSSSNQTTSAARLNWLITQPTLARCTLKQTGSLSFLQHFRTAETKYKECFLVGLFQDFKQGNSEFGSKQNQSRMRMLQSTRTLPHCSCFNHSYSIPKNPQ